ncbi:hypothetical protein WSK_4079 [Novosphingobium sp. Rr 2-17]|uniref:DUF1838 family protein n=1 Tax=Novosphingobium sp. Rr 2-17 TaxID=555793 RepID=UPI0002699F3A|nr:DUF1838 family protein [Novosphingobium sp. Rr 2-17]EIZ77347.1 hypothetical protein WSK_4079 [Novosphingobium sp. Rr 2-17]
MSRMLDVTRPDRRDAMKLGLGLAATAAALPGVAARAATRLLDPANPDDARLIYRKLRYRTDDGLLFSWIRGPYMAAYEGDLIPMYALNLGAIQRITHNPDGSFNLIDLEISFRVDAQTGERLKTLRNPITGETVPVGGRGPVPTHLKVSADNDFVIPDVPGQPQYDHSHVPVSIFPLGRTEMAMRDRSHARVTAPDGSVSYLNEVSTISAPRDQVLDPRTTSLNSRVQSNDVRSWPAWLNMGARPGTLALFANGGKVSHFADLPDDWHAMLKQYYPQIAADPIAVLDGKIKIPAATW